MRLHRAMVFVNDLARMTAGYETLGLKRVDATRLDDYVEFEAGSATFALHAIPADMRGELPAHIPPREKTPIKLSFEVRDVDSERRRLEALGVTVLRRPWGAYEWVDPEGNVFGIDAVRGD
jgi:catechol 2,3-dioxygenase-like lactoylglutathione lyase family enzyme